MINAMTCKIANLFGIDEYCTRNIEPALLRAKGAPVYFGRWNKDGTISYDIHKIYAKDRPTLVRNPFADPISPFAIKEYLTSLGYNVIFTEVIETYPAGKSASGKTCYYPSGSNKYYSLKITV